MKKTMALIMTAMMLAAFVLPAAAFAAKGGEKGPPPWAQGNKSGVSAE